MSSKLREVLKEVYYKNKNVLKFEHTLIGRQLKTKDAQRFAMALTYAGDIERIIEAALAKPPRNCDVYDLTRAKAEYKKYRTEICWRESNPFIAQDETLPFDEWLFAEAEGETK